MRTDPAPLRFKDRHSSDFYGFHLLQNEVDYPEYVALMISQAGVNCHCISITYNLISVDEPQTLRLVYLSRDHSEKMHIHSSHREERHNMKLSKNVRCR